jgi:phage terminase small subunit
MLTPKQEKFAKLYIELGNASEAYRQSYDASKMKPDVVNVKASELLANGKVAVRVKQLQDAAVKRHEVTVDDIIAELDEARNLAKNANVPKTGDMISASMGKAKVLGLIKDKTELSGAVEMAVRFNAEHAKRIAQEVLVSGISE